MLDIKFIRQHREEVERGLKNKGVAVDLACLLVVDERRRAKIKLVDELRAEHNQASDEVAALGGEAREQRIGRVKDLKDTLADAEFELKALEEEFRELMYQIPNIPFPDVPVGPDDSANKILRIVGEIPKFDFEPKDHVALGEALDIIDIGRAAKVTGSRFGYFKREAAILEFALIQFGLERLTNSDFLHKAVMRSSQHKGIIALPSEKQFIPVVPPVMIRPDVFTKMARLSPADKNERYYIPSDDLYLIGSAEHTLGAMHMDETIKEEDLPLRYVGFSTSFRREAGSYGKDIRGVLRVHQFDKLEIESFTAPQESLREQEFFVAIQELLLQELGISYQVVLLSTGDMGKPDARQIDIECWLPGQGKYRETHSADLMTDYQSRRLNTKVKFRDGHTEFAHMNDATMFAIGRMLIAILENYQQADGSVRIPEILQPYIFGLKEIKR